ncbi:MAG: DUF3098 domain-containing protein [Phaeodactylibacter sp.]|uniref:DUF3098 domain-containing protein n=1 Tax=Phaeodactylibacter sp. TaxID=1940289 RepID=UPI0032EC9C98
MSKEKPGKKKVVVTTDKSSKEKKMVKPTSSRRGAREVETSKVELEFGKANYILIAGGLGLVFLGLILMAGGDMPSPDVWEEDLIYSARRTVLAPIVILLGLGMEVWAIFKK